MVEHQLLTSTSVAISYINSHGLHLLRSEDINAPLPGTYDPSRPGSGAFPYSTSDPIFLTTSSGLYNQNEMIVNINSRLNSQVNLFGFYALNKAMSNTDGISTFPANPYDYSGEYGPASTDIRHRVLLGGSINTKWNVRLSPYVTLQSGTPFDITVGRDLYGTTLFNGRPGIATNPNDPGVIQTAYGLLNPNPTPGEPTVPRNYGRGPGLVAMNVRLSKTFGFGADRETAARQGGAASGSMGSSKIPTGKELRGLFGAPPTSHRYSLTIGLSARNILNHDNPGPIIGDVTSSLFGRANQIYGTPNGEGFLETANNRRLELQIQFKF
jgi:hypothetical protein